ncbi:MAG: PH domain-containing protein [Gemmataceae bacterium]
MATMIEARQQAVTGVVPPQTAEAIIREVWPSVTTSSGIATLGEKLIRSIILAPLGWMLMLPIYFFKVLPFVARRYTLTNRRIMVRRGLRPAPTHEVALADIDEVRLDRASANRFFRSATLEILSKGQVALTLPGVPDPESFRAAIRNACMAWVPGKAATMAKGS